MELQNDNTSNKQQDNENIKVSLNDLRRSVTILRKELHNIRAKLVHMDKIHLECVNEIRFQQLPPIAQDSPQLQDDCVRMRPIGYMESPFTHKNATPRQPSVCQQTKGKLKLLNTTLNNPSHALQGLDQFSHVWLIFVFHQNKKACYKKGKVCPPRLNGKKTGVFATRTPHRINPLGLSLVKLDKIEGDCLHLSGIDMIDGTPILDIKPYIPCYDEPREVAAAAAAATATAMSSEIAVSVVVPDWITSPTVQQLNVRFTPTAEAQLNALITTNDDLKCRYPDLQSVQSILVSILREDPRSIYRRSRCKELLYYFIYDNFHLTCWVDEDESVVEIVKINLANT